MPFSENVKLQVKKRADFRCCRCRNIGIDVHHIVPENKGGSCDIHNAAPLCQNCHDQFGDNPQKRKEITQMRDCWYERVEAMYAGGRYDFELLRQIDEKVDRIQHSQLDTSELKDLLRTVSNSFIDSITPQTATAAASGIVNTMSAVRLSAGTYSNFHCGKCNTTIGLLVGSDKCPTCGTPIV